MKVGQLKKTRERKRTLQAEREEEELELTNPAHLSRDERKRLMEKPEDREGRVPFSIGMFLLIVGTIYALYRLTSWALTETLSVVSQYVSLGVVHIAAALSTFMVGSLLYRMRCRSPFIYGMVEIALGVLFAGYVVNQILGYAIKDAGVYFTIAGAIYIIVRGYDSVYRSLKWGSPLLKLMNRLFFGRRVYRRL